MSSLVLEGIAIQHTRLGRTGLKVSRLCLGTMTFGLQIDERSAISVLDRAAEGGVTFIDTADVYPLGGGMDLTGTTEEIIGRWLKGRRNEFVLATKAFGRTGPQPWDAGNNRRHIMDAIDASLRRTVEERILALEEFERFRDSLHEATERARDALR